MSTIVRQISKEESADWDKFVASSHQAGIFHSTNWNQMLYETAPQSQQWAQLVCEKKGSFLGGIALHYWSSGSKMEVPIPVFGYNGPILSPEVEYEKPYKTIPGYEIIQELIKGVTDLANPVLIKNQPAIWDVRAYLDNGWKVETQYTHLLHCTTSEDMWKGFDPIIQQQINTDQYSIHTDISDTQIRKFSLHAFQKIAPMPPHQEVQRDVLKKRIYWMKENGLCKLVTLIDKTGNELAIALFILSRENRTIYLCKTIPLAKEPKNNVLPSVIWQSYLSFGEGFEHMDLGTSKNMAISTAKDQLGCSLAPIYITKHQRS